MQIVLFDFDGVIADTFSFCYKIIHSRDSITPAEYRARFEGNINNARKKVRRGNSSFDFFAQYTPELMTCPPTTEVAAAIDSLARDFILIIVSSTISSSIAFYLERYGLRAHFREILGNDVDKSKTKKIRDVLRKYDIAPAETVFVTDTLGDIKEASECGVGSIAVTWGYHPAETLAKGRPWRIIHHPAQLASAVRAAAARVSCAPS